MISFIDANVLVHAFTESKDKNKCRQLLNEGFVTNTLCLVEAEHAIALIKQDKAYASDCIKSLFRGGGIIIPLDRNLLFQSFRLRKNPKLQSLDSFDMIHYATALAQGCAYIFSYDEHFDGLPIKRIKPN